MVMRCEYCSNGINRKGAYVGVYGPSGMMYSHAECYEENGGKLRYATRVQGNPEVMRGPREMGEMASAKKIERKEVTWFTPGFMRFIKDTYTSGATQTYGSLYTSYRTENGVGIYNMTEGKWEFFIHDDIIGRIDKALDALTSDSPFNWLISKYAKYYESKKPGDIPAWFNAVDRKLEPEISDFPTAEEYVKGKRIREEESIADKTARLQEFVEQSEREDLGWAYIRHPSGQVEKANLAILRGRNRFIGLIEPHAEGLKPLYTEPMAKREILGYFKSIYVPPPQSSEENPIGLATTLAASAAMGAASGLAFYGVGRAMGAMPAPVKNPKRKYRRNPDSGETEVEEVKEDNPLLSGDKSEEILYEKTPTANGNPGDSDSGTPPKEELHAAVGAFKKFHAFAHNKVERVKLPKPRVLTKLGDWTAVGYFSDKWGKKKQEYRGGKGQRYIHEFESWPGEAGVVAWAPDRSDKTGERGTVIAWGRARLTSHGIEDDDSTKGSEKK